jgi:hypothetical protein
MTDLTPEKLAELEALADGGNESWPAATVQALVRVVREMRGAIDTFRYDKEQAAATVQVYAATIAERDAEIARLNGKLEAVRAAANLAQAMIQTAGHHGQPALSKQRVFQAVNAIYRAAYPDAALSAASTAGRCICGDGPTGDYEGYRVDCPQHGAASTADAKHGISACCNAPRTGYGYCQQCGKPSEPASTAGEGQ